MEVEVKNFLVALSFPLSCLWLWLVNWERTRKTSHDAFPRQAVSQLSSAGEEGKVSLCDSVTIGLSILRGTTELMEPAWIRCMTDLLPLHSFKGMAKDKTFFIFVLFCLLKLHPWILHVEHTGYLLKVGSGKGIFQGHVHEFYREKWSLNQFSCFLRAPALAVGHINAREPLSSGSLQYWVSYSE